MLLAIESSCDDTSVAVLDNSKVLSNVVSTQYYHRKYGGIVPELASRSHLQNISELAEQSLKLANVAMSDINVIGVTAVPGLVGSLIVGSNFAKGIALRYGLPIVPINHIEGHIFSGFLTIGNAAKLPDFPLMTLVVSGGHTAIFLVESFNNYRAIGLTKDDAAGEAFDKIAKLCGLGYPGGPLIDKLARKGCSKKFDFPRSMLYSGDYDFSFSGLKTSVRYFLQKEFPNGIPEEVLADIAASVQAAITDVLVAKTIKAAQNNNVKTIVIAGGVSANTELRNKMNFESNKIGITCIAPSMDYCMDNAAMIGYIAEMKFKCNPDMFNHFDYTVSANALRRRM